MVVLGLMSALELCRCNNYVLHAVAIDMTSSVLFAKGKCLIFFCKDEGHDPAVRALQGVFQTDPVNATGLKRVLTDSTA